LFLCRPPVEGTGPAEDSQEGKEHAALAGHPSADIKEDAAEPLPSTDAGKSVGEHGTHQRTTVIAPVVVPNAANNPNRYSDGPSSPKEKSGLLSKIFRRKSVKEPQGSTARNMGAGVAAGATVAAVEHKETPAVTEESPVVKEESSSLHEENSVIKDEASIRDEEKEPTSLSSGLGEAAALTTVGTAAASAGLSG
jgi:hypothetical protein